MIFPTPRFGVGAVLRTVLFLCWIAILGHKLGPVPPPGLFLSPFQGFWRNAETRAPRNSEVKMPGLDGNVSLEYDRRGVPHIFAKNLSGMFFAQGYATARDRLWQMDIQSRAGMGRLSEVMGPALLRFDLEHSRMGMAASARISLVESMKDSAARTALEAYSAGVNAWMASLSPADYPFEFKLLDYAPEAWTPLKSVALLKNMQWTLSRGDDDNLLTNTLQKLGPKIFKELFPLRNPGAEPILPADVFSIDGNAGTPVAGAARRPLQPALLNLQSPSEVEGPRPQPGSGSNNFVIAGSRTESGHPILGNDPHLDLSLPSIWYESQLQGGGVNAYGVSIPGLPGIVIGFNERAAWGLTNGMDDVFDWYEIRFKDESMREYFWNGGWQPTRSIIDTILVRGGKPVIDTMVWTHLGPVPVKNGEKPFDGNTPVLHALRWTALDSSNDIGAFIRLLSVENYADFRSAIRGLGCPSQNFVFADSGNIALVHQGRIPVKTPGQGRTVINEGDSSSEWHGFIPDSLLPASLDPARGWLASANQEATDSTYPFYLGSGFYSSERAGRLNRLLESVKGASLPSAWQVMMNVQSLHAEQTLPLLLRCIDSQAMSSEARQAVNVLRAWDYGYRTNAVAPALFDLWWSRFYKRTWEDDFEDDTVDYKWPSRAVTRALLASDPTSHWFDDIRTPKRENAGDLGLMTLEEAAQKSLQLGHGSFVSWAQFHPLSIPHLLRLPALGKANLSGDGCGECLDAQRGSHGPSWRMAVELGNTPAAIGGYPGGQSGNPGSPHYDDFVENWLKGRPYSLLFLKQADEHPDSIAYTFSLRGSQ